MEEIIELLRSRGIQPTPQRIAVMEFLWGKETHPSADEILEKIHRKYPTISRATVYNTLNLFVEKGLLRQQILKEGTAVFDPKVELHHHFIDEDTGKIYDIPWGALQVKGERYLKGFKVREFQVIMRGKRIEK